MNRTTATEPGNMQQHTPRPGPVSARSTAGFTLIEVMIAMVIFSLCVLAVAAMHVSAINANATSRQFSMATSVASAQLERIMDLDYDTSADVAVGTHGPVATADGIFNVDWTVAAGTRPNTRTVFVRVRWNSHKGPRQLTLTGLTGAATT